VLQVAALCCALLVSTSAAAEANTVSAEDAAEGARLFDQGLAAFEAGDMPTALDELARAHARAPNYRSAALLGQVELELGHYVGAATHLDESVRLFPQGTDVEGFGRVMDGLTEARRHVCTLRVQSPTRGAELWLDGERQGALPLDRDLFVAPGTHRVELRAPGFASRAQQEELPRGAIRDLRLQLDPLPGLDRDATPGRTEAPPAARVTLWTGGALTLLGVATGAVFELSARSSEADARKLRDSGDCSANGSCTELTSRSHRATTQHDVAGVAFVSAGAVGVLTVSLFALLSGDGDGGKAERDVAWTPWVAPEAAGFGVVGGF
jgi:tetratricopeptide (TPR) repeat protein